MASQLEFTNNWFEKVRPVWDRFILNLNPTRILEVGSHEGASACFLIQKLGAAKAIELHCIDTWEGGVEHQAGAAYASDMSEVELRFHKNVSIARAEVAQKVEIVLHKGASDMELSKLLASGQGGSFDFIYIDGSHLAADVLCDAVLGFRLLRIGGVIVFDDYLWTDQSDAVKNPLRSPKLAIDAFTTIYAQKIRLVNVPLRQICVQKVSD